MSNKQPDEARLLVEVAKDIGGKLITHKEVKPTGRWKLVTIDDEHEMFVEVVITRKVNKVVGQKRFWIFKKNITEEIVEPYTYFISEKRLHVNTVYYNECQSDYDDMKSYKSAQKQRELTTIIELTNVVKNANNDGARVDGVVQQLCLCLDDFNDENNVYSVKATVALHEYFDNNPDYAF